MRLFRPFLPLFFLAVLCGSIVPLSWVRGQSSDKSVSSPQVPQWQKDAGGSAHFDVASVKQDTGTGFYTNINLLGDTFSPTGGLLSMKNYPLQTYIGFAYKLLVDARHSPQLPGWAKTNRYDIEAHAPAGMNPTKDQYRLMMQALLADRFKFAMHTETRQEPIFAMVLDKSGKLGPQLKQHSDPADCSTAPPPAPGPAPTVGGPGLGLPESCGTLLALTPVHSGQYRQGARNVPLSRLSSWIGASPGPCGIDRHVTDETRLTGPFDFVWEWSPTGRGSAGATRETDPDGPSCLEALKQQLGLKLIPKTGPVDHFVLDHIEEPSPN